MKKELINEIKLMLFAALTGSICSLVFWLFLIVVKAGTTLLWEIIPSRIGIVGVKAYPLIICTAGGLIIGIFRKAFGDVPFPFIWYFRGTGKW